MRKLYFLALLAVLCLGLGWFALSCSPSGGGDDDSGGDDDDAADDDATDDDATDDDTADDDATDDDAADDDDTFANLTWQEPPSSDYMTCDEAKAYCENLGFDGHDDWRLPTISELRSLILGCDGTVTGGACGVTDGCNDSSLCWNDACRGCDYLAGPGSGGAYWPDGMSGEIGWYWSSSPIADNDGNAWGVSFGGGGVDSSYVNYPNSARCVR